MPAALPPIAKLKDKAREVARQFRKSTGSTLPHSRALDAVAAQYGFATWAELMAEHGAQDAGHANANKAPAVGADAVAYPSLPALLAGREADAPLIVTLVAAPAGRGAGAAPEASGGAPSTAQRPPDEAQPPRTVAVFSDIRRGIQRYAAHWVADLAERRLPARTRDPAIYVAISRLLKPLKLPLSVADRQSVSAPLWPRAEPLSAAWRGGGDAASMQAALRVEGPLVLAETGWLMQAARLLRVERCWTLGRRDAAGVLAPVAGPGGVPPAFAGRRPTEAMIAWYAGELGGLEPMPLPAGALDAGGPNGQHAPSIQPPAGTRTEP